MTSTPVYLLTIPGNSAIQISQDELRSHLGEIENKLHHSKVYRSALATLQNLLGSSSEQAKLLFKAVSREAIALAVQQFALQQKATEVNQIDPTDVSITVEPENGDLSPCLTNVKLNTNNQEGNTSEDNLISESSVVLSTAENPVKTTENKPQAKTPMKWLKRTKKPSKAEIASSIAAEQRLANLRKVGQQLRQAREAQGLSLSQLKVYTHVPIHHMEAVENCNLELLPVDVYLRGFIRVMGNALGLNGTELMSCLPAPDIAKSVLPMNSYKPRSGSPGLGLDIRPVHLYVGYTALVAGAVGGLSVMSGQANADRAMIPDEAAPPTSASRSSGRIESSATPGLRSSTNGISVGSDIAPPEAL